MTVEIKPVLNFEDQEDRMYPDHLQHNTNNTKLENESLPEGKDGLGPAEMFAMLTQSLCHGSQLTLPSTVKDAACKSRRTITFLMN